MTKQYSCELCQKVFNQKIDYARHQKKKTSCVTLTDLQQMNKVLDNKSRLINDFKNCLNILRDNEGLTGEKALRNLSYLLLLKLLEPQFGVGLDIDNYPYDFGHIEYKNVDRHKNKLLKVARFSNLAIEEEDNIPNLMKHLWDDILSNHPSTRNIFFKDKGFDIQHKSSFKKLIDKLNSLDLSQNEYDVLGSAYEEVIQGVMTGKVLGQFFTQPLVKKMMVQLIDPKIYPDGKIETCGDPAMGTGGFLITYLKHILQQAKVDNIKPDWDFIKTQGLYGKEIEPDTYQLAVSNMLISSGHMFESLDRGDSIRVPITRKFDNILANPPFGIKGLKYEDFQSPLKHEYVPIKTDNAVSLFIQAIIYMLKINGKCAVVLPDGQDLFSKTNKTLVAVREYLIKTCDLKEVIYLPSGIFTYTSIKTCVFYFVKKRHGSEVIETKQSSKSSRDLVFTNTLQTVKVKFYDFNPYEDVKNLLVEVPIEKIASNSYSLNYAEYMKDETEEEQYEQGVVVKTLGEVCNFKNGKGIKKDSLIEGEYPVIGGGQKPMGFHNEYNTDANTILCSSSGAYAGFISKYDKKVWASDCFSIKANNNSINNTYLYYLLKTIQDKIYKLQTGTAQPHIYSKDLLDIKIPIPTLDKQQEVVKYLDFIFERANKTSYEKIAELKQLNEFCFNNQKMFGVVVKTLGEVCKDISTSKAIPSSDRVDGPFRFFTCSREETTHNGYHYDGTFIIHGSRGSTIKESIFMTNNEKFAIGTSMFISEVKNNLECDSKYIYYYLKLNQSIFHKFINGTAIPMISKSNYYDLKIPILPLDKQKEMVEYCKYNDTLVKQLEQEIENNKKQAQQFITSILN